MIRFISYSIHTVCAFLVVPVLGFFLVYSQNVNAQSLSVFGYADFETFATFTEDDSGESETDFFFDNHHFNVVVMGNIYGDIFAASEVEYEHGGEEIALEYGYIGYTGFKNVRVMAGKFIVPFGRFNKDLHPSWINKMVDRPFGFERILPQTYSDVGVWISGASEIGDGQRIVFDAFVVNGLMGEDGGDIRGMRDNDRDRQNDGERDNNKAVGGRLGIEIPGVGVDLGGSVYSGNYSDDHELDLNLTLLGVDASYRNGGLELRGEFVSATQEISSSDLKKTGGYVQAAYRTSSQFEPVVRYSMRDFPGDSSRDQSRFSLGVNYYVSPASSIRLNYHINTETHSEFESENDQLALQFNVAF